MKLNFSSMKFQLSLFAGIIIVLTTVSLVAVSYNAAYDAIEKAYINQIKNFNSDLNRQLEEFYKLQENSAYLLASNPDVIDSIKSGNFAAASGIIDKFSSQYAIYENVLLSTPEKNSRVLSASMKKTVGMRWGSKGFDDNILLALKGKPFSSNVDRSPFSGVPVMISTAPVLYNKKIVGIVALSVDIAPYACKIVKGIKIGKTGYPFISRPDGLVFGHPGEKYVFTLDLKEYDWGRRFVESKDEQIINYPWQGKQKMLLGKKNPNYLFASGITLYVSDIRDDARNMAAFMIIFGAVSICFSMFIIFWLMRRKLQPLEYCTEMMMDIAQGEGDLTRRINIKSKDEIGELAEWFNRFVQNINSIIAQVKNASITLVKAVEEISAGNENLSQRTSEQAASIEEIASTIEETNSSAIQNSENAIEANNLSQKSLYLAEEGGKISGNAVSAINGINDVSRKIGEIISVINEISFQTNLLALNAAVEAARAGEAGRGFAVVAGEIRNLAQRSGEAAGEIEKLIHDTVEKIEQGSGLVIKSGESLTQIIESMKNTGQLVAEITSAIMEEREGMQQITTAITGIDSMTQQNAALVEETASAGEEMAGQANELRNLVERFKVDENIQ